MKAGKVRVGMTCIPVGGTEADRQTVVGVERLQGGEVLITFNERGRARWWRTTPEAHIGGRWSR